MLAACLDTCCWWRVLLYAVHVLGCFWGAFTETRSSVSVCQLASSRAILVSPLVFSGVLWCFDTVQVGGGREDANGRKGSPH